MAVVAVLIALLMPSLSTVREAARKVVCASNVRQIGLGLAMYADDYRGLLPPTKFALTSHSGARRTNEPQSMMMLRTSEGPNAWDGLGALFFSGYLDAAGVFYCPSHHGDHPLSRYGAEWGGLVGPIFANYHFRGSGAITLDTFQSGAALVADGLRLQSDYNHRVGANVLHADLRVAWFSDPSGAVGQSLPAFDGDPEAADKVEDAWNIIDNHTRAR
jgi:hypothetical protein